MDNTQDKSKKREVTYINYNIRNPKVRIIDEVTKQQSVMDTNAAISLAQSKGLDLVEIAFDKASLSTIFVFFIPLQSLFLVDIISI